MLHSSMGNKISRAPPIEKLREDLRDSCRWCAALLGAFGTISSSYRPTVKHLQFKWVLRDQQYEFSALAQTSRGQQPEVEAELVEIWTWLQRQKLRPGQFGWDATRKTLTSKIETLSVSQGAVEGDGETIFHPQETRLVLTLPDTVAVNFRFEFNVVDDRG